MNEGYVVDYIGKNRAHRHIFKADIERNLIPTLFEEQLQIQVVCEYYRERAVERTKRVSRSGNRRAVCARVDDFTVARCPDFEFDFLAVGVDVDRKVYERTSRNIDNARFAAKLVADIRGHNATAVCGTAEEIDFAQNRHRNIRVDNSIAEGVYNGLFDIRCRNRRILCGHSDCSRRSRNVGDSLDIANPFVEHHSVGGRIRDNLNRIARSNSSAAAAVFNRERIIFDSLVGCRYRYVGSWHGENCLSRVYVSNVCCVANPFIESLTFLRGVCNYGNLCSVFVLTASRAVYNRKIASRALRGIAYRRSGIPRFRTAVDIGSRADEVVVVYALFDSHIGIR